MVRYDSQSKILQLQKKYVIAGDTPTSLTGSLDLSKLTNQEQQRLIAVAKLVLQFSTNHDVTHKIVVGTEKDKSIAPSLLAETQRIINQVKPLSSEANKDVQVRTGADTSPTLVV